MYDPRVLVRIQRGREQDAADYIELLDARRDFIRRMAAITAPYDALVMPTTPITAPRIADLASDDAYRHANAADAAQSGGGQLPGPLLDFGALPRSLAMRRSG